MVSWYTVQRCCASTLEILSEYLTAMVGQASISRCILQVCLAVKGTLRGAGGPSAFETATHACIIKALTRRDAFG